MNHPGAAPSVPSARRPDDSGLAARLPLWAWLALGIALTALTGMRWNIALLGWVAPVPFMLAARRVQGWRGWGQVFLAVNAGYALSVLKMVTPPLAAPAALVFSIPGATTLFLLLALWAWIARGVGRAWAVYSFVALMTLADWAGLALSYSGAWATQANSQLDNLPLLQLASLGGLSLIGALMALVVANLFLFFDAPEPGACWRHYLIAFTALVAALGWGAVRLDELGPAPVLRVAGITTPLGLGGGMPGAAQLAANTDDLFARSKVAARRGAQLVAWNEAATLVLPEGEAALHARGSAFARGAKVDFVMAYGVLLHQAPLLIDNKYEWFGPDGASLEVYRKHHPVIGEPSLKGDAPIRVLNRPWGKAAGAICYDYDFPALAREQARGGAAVAVVPASDWRGIDPYHGLMARVRAIEGGMSVVRPVRDATSMLFDPYGRIRAGLNAREDNGGIIMGIVPVRQVKTPYTALGDWPAYLAAVFLLGVLAKRGGRRRKQAAAAAL